MGIEHESWAFCNANGKISQNFRMEKKRKSEAGGETLQ